MWKGAVNGGSYHDTSLLGIEKHAHSYAGTGRSKKNVLGASQAHAHSAPQMPVLVNSELYCWFPAGIC